MTDISHPLTFPVITTTMSMGAKCFSFWCFRSLQGENHALLQSLPFRGPESLSPTLIFIPVTLGRPCALSKAFSFIFLKGGNYSGSRYGGSRLMGTGGSRPVLPSVRHFTRRQKMHDSICTLNLQPPDLNSISGQFSFRFSSCKVKQCLF